MNRRQPRSTLFPYRVLIRSSGSHRKLDPAEGIQDAQLNDGARLHVVHGDIARDGHTLVNVRKFTGVAFRSLTELVEDRKSTRLNSSHANISYAVFCLKKNSL